MFYNSVGRALCCVQIRNGKSSYYGPGDGRYFLPFLKTIQRLNKLQRIFLLIDNLYKMPLFVAQHEYLGSLAFNTNTYLESFYF